jgi:cyclase
MRNTRIIARLDIKGPNLIKGIHLEGLRKLGDPHEFANRYAEQGIDEIIYMDSVASLYGRNSLVDIVANTSENIFVPITVGGGIRSVDDAWSLFKAGADKVAINTAAIKTPSLISDIANRFGNQSVVLSVEAKRRSDGGWEAYVDNGREHTGIDVCEWVCAAETLGVGEVLLTSIDQEGTQRGYDLPLMEAVSKLVNVPIIASGGAGNLEHIRDAVLQGGADAVALAHLLHYGKQSVSSIKAFAIRHHIPVRPTRAAPSA